ncbi:hypothetical protein HW571_18990 [Agrobacterium genomosp. 3]|uniref:hypothetical protein n=1 Tax=Agrobacterium tomkonis TaxID=1183410 RepID=UPI00021707D9|nr:hypothetical protein Agau_P200304 [Agrobacterium tumefaciens F2]MCA1867767.1 hypothetical protein [Agrobacterium tomkonis]MCA1878070.1 hypothetical protein [Agrobacterium tumefaciens]MCA1893295.1 hypothetical protein [Agrobacterium tomkonis]
MTDTHSKSRQQAETAFGAVQTQFFAKNSATEELEAAAQARDAKTLRLREARLAKESADRIATTSHRADKRVKSR